MSIVSTAKTLSLLEHCLNTAQGLYEELPEGTKDDLSQMSINLATLRYEVLKAKENEAKAKQVGCGKE